MCGSKFERYPSVKQLGRESLAVGWRYWITWLVVVQRLDFGEQLLFFGKFWKQCVRDGGAGYFFVFFSVPQPREFATSINLDCNIYSSHILSLGKGLPNVKIALPRSCFMMACDF